MAVTPDEALHVAALARLHLDVAELERFTEQLNSILSHVAELADADADSVEALAAAVDWNAPLRGDEPGGDPLRLPPWQMAPAWSSGFFTLPRLPALEGGAAGSNA
jgi:aspartyl-tRNA(Asn)/glutamyl-tRNA(Gln) amidotransferase subunit C